MDFLLDPYVVAAPKVITNSDQLSNYINSLLDWIRLKKSSGHNFWFTTHLASALTEDESYPYPSVIKRSCKGVKIKDDDVFNLETAIRAIQSDFIEPKYLEEKIGDFEVDFELIESVVLPDEIQSRLSPPVAFALKKSLVMMAIAGTKHGSEFAQNVFVASNPLPADSNEVMIDFNHLIATDDFEHMIASWRLVSRPTQLDDIEGLLKFWLDTQRALTWAYGQLRADNSLNNSHKYPEPLVGSIFNESIVDAHFDRNLTVLDALFRNTVLAIHGVGGFERGGRKHHELRTGHQASQPQQVRASDGATAWRVHLCSVVRLHYWLLPDGRVELSRVTNGNHNDFYIA